MGINPSPFHSKRLFRDLSDEKVNDKEEKRKSNTRNERGTAVAE